MKNFFFDFNFEKSRENGRLLFKTIEKTEIASEQLAKIEALQNSQKARLPLAVSAETHQKLGKLSPKKAEKKAVEKTSQGAKESTKKLAENDEKKEFTPKDAENMAKDCMEKFALQDPKFEEALKSDNPRQAIREYTENPPPESRENFLKYLKEYSNEHKLSDHFNWAIDKKGNLGNFGKIFTAFFTVGALSNEGGFKDSLWKGVKLGGIAAALSHPAVTGTASHLLKKIGKGSYNIAKYPISILVDFVYDPGKFSREFADRARKGEIPFTKDDVELTSEMLKSTTDPLLLRERGMQFSSDLNDVLDGINQLKKPKSSEEREKILEKIRPQAVQFLAQTENLAKGISHKDVVKMGRKIWENDPKNPPQDSDYHLVLMWKSREIIKKQFKTDKNFNNEVARIKNNLSGADKNKLKELGVEDLDKVFAVDGKDFAKITAEKKHGIRRALSNMSGTALITYILMFLLTKGVMSGSHALQNIWGNTKDFREKSTKDKLKTIGNFGGKIVFFFPKELWSMTKFVFGKNDKAMAKKDILRIGTSKDGGFGWDKDKQNIWKNYKNKDKVVKKYFETMKKKKEEYAKAKKVAKAIKDKAKKKEELEKVENMKGLTKEEMKSLFSGDSEIVKKLFS